MRATSLFSLRRTLLPQTLPGILLCLLLGAWGFRWVLIVFNPPDLNHLLIINRSGHELVTEGVAELEGEVGWQFDHWHSPACGAVRGSSDVVPSSSSGISDVTLCLRRQMN